jgi:hypothetical protein
VKTTVTRTLISTLLAAAVLTTAGGCFLLPTSPPTAAAPTPTESVTPSETPTPTPEPVVVTCENAISAATITSWEGDGVTQNPDFVQKLNDESNSLVDFANNGGIICQWGFANGGATAIYGYSKISEADLISVQNHLGDDLGADVSVFSGNNLYTVNTPEYSEGTEYYLFSAGPTDYFWMYAWSTDLLDEMLANIPNP